MEMDFPKHSETQQHLNMIQARSTKSSDLVSDNKSSKS